MAKEPIKSDFVEIGRRYGTDRRLTDGDLLFRQGEASDGFYYVKEGTLGVYKETRGTSHLLSRVSPGETVGELGATTGWRRTATVRALRPSLVVHISSTDFWRALDESPGLAAAVVCQVGERLTDADEARLRLGRSHDQAVRRVEALCSEMDRLEELLRLRQELADTIVHDLHNPLAVISAGLQMLERIPVAQPYAEDASSLIDAMARSTARMTRLVDTLMDIASLERGHVPLHRRPIHVPTLVEGVLTEERPLAEYKSIHLESHIPSQLPAVEADQDVLQRVLINLVDNALKFTPRGGRVWVEAQPVAGAMELAVADTGPGIPPHERERIFERFTQGRIEAGRRRGSGLGLAFCRMAVEAHGGRIWVEKTPKGGSGGHGARFVIRLPSAGRQPASSAPGGVES